MLEELNEVHHLRKPERSKTLTRGDWFVQVHLTKALLGGSRDTKDGFDLLKND